MTAPTKRWADGGDPGDDQRPPQVEADGGGHHVEDGQRHDRAV
jgi:hypothetical protein